MMQFASLGAFATHLRSLPSRLAEAKRAGLKAAAVIIAAEAKSFIGHYQGEEGPFPEWPQLADRTVAERVAQGYAPDRPLERTGVMRASITEEVESEKCAVIGSVDPVAKWQEKGTDKNGEPRIPARSFLGRAAFTKGEEAAKVIRDHVAAAFAENP